MRLLRALVSFVVTALFVVAIAQAAIGVLIILPIALAGLGLVIVVGHLIERSLL